MFNRISNSVKSFFLRSFLTALVLVSLMANAFAADPVTPEELWGVIDLTGVQLKLLALYGTGLTFTLATIIFFLVRKGSKRAAKA